ncbi:MAG: mechanosensitive ion channel family protein [Bacteroidetes bacterium]|nr:MAG: mechanosensitive ion channel family protein [Bacteroidota bacterium]
MESWSEWINHTLGVSHSFQYKLLVTIVIALFLYGLRQLIIHLLFRNVREIKTWYNWKKGITYFIYVLFLVMVSPIWIIELQSLGTFLGLLSAGLAVALKDPISNFFAWAYIMLKQPFEMGDRVQINDSEGDILDIGFFEFTMLEIKNWVEADQSTGRIIHVPNGLLFTHPIINYNQALGYIWNEIPVLITFESDWQKAKRILLDIEQSKLKKLITKSQAEARLNLAQKKYNLSYSTLEPTVYTSIKENGVMLTLRYLCNPRKRRDSQQVAIEAILEAFAKEPNITFAYPTTRFYDATREGAKAPVQET